MPDKPSPQNEPTIGDVTGDFVPQPEDPTEAGDGTRDADASMRPGDMTSAFLVNVEPQDSQTVDQPGRTDLRGRDETGAASAGAFPRQAPQSRTGRYALKNFHAKGGMGEVWLADDVHIGREVALKRMRGGREEHKERFLLEAQVTGQLEHPGVIPVHDVDLDESGQPYYVMKFVRGQTLTKAIEDYHSGGSAELGTRNGEQKDESTPSSALRVPSSQPPKEVQRLRLLNIFIDLCQTMAFAHSRGVIHRDIKPDNVMVGAYGETLVLDWGLAKVVGRPETTDLGPPVRLSSSGESLETLAGSVKGTPSYLSPEVAFGRVEEVDQVSDVYLLGGTLYHILTGQKPRHGTKLAEILEAARTKPPVPARQLDPSIDKPINAICMKALAYKKEDRYKDAGELAEDLHRYMAGEPVVAYQENFLERAVRWMRKHRRAIAQTAMGVLVISVFAGSFLIIRDVQRKAAIDQEIAAKLQRENKARQDRDRFRELGEEMRFHAANADPDGGGSFYDLDKAEKKGKEALAIAQAWGPKLELFPLGDEERATLKEEAYDLLLWMAQVGTRHSEPDKLSANLQLLDQASSLQTPTQSYYRLRNALALAKNEADGEKKVTDQPDAPLTALDHFLAGEELRKEAGRTRVGEGKKEESKKWKLLNAAREKYLSALRADPNHFWANYQLGLILLGLEKPAEAAGAWSACIALRPKSPWGWMSRASALAVDKRFADAHKDLAEARRLDPSSTIVRYLTAFVLAQEKKPVEALAELDAVAKTGDEAPYEVWFLRGSLRFNQNEFEQAMPDIERTVAAKRPPRVAFLYQTRGLLREGKIDAGLASLDRFIADGQDINLKDPATYERRAKELRLLSTEGWVKSRKAVLELALAQADKAIALDDKRAGSHDERGSILDRLGRFPEAIAAYSKAIDADPKNPKILVRRGWEYDKLPKSDFKKGLRDFTAAVDLDAKDGEALAGLGYYQAWTEAPDKARVNANLATMYGGGDYVVLHNVACIFATLSHTDKARAREYEDMAIGQLRRGVELWKKDTRQDVLSAIVMMENEGAFPPSLKSRSEFLRIIEENKEIKK